MVQVGRGRYSSVWKYARDHVLKLASKDNEESMAGLVREREAYCAAKGLQGGVLPTLHAFGKFGEVGVYTCVSCCVTALS